MSENVSLAVCGSECVITAWSASSGDTQWTCADISVSKCFFNLVIGMKPFRAFSLLVEPPAVTHGFVLFKMDKNISFLCTVKMHEKRRLIQCMCVTL